MVDWNDTIVALATGFGDGCRAILRLSGPNAHRVILSYLDGPWKYDSQRKTSGEASFKLGSIDREISATLFFWPANRSYTGQAIAELHFPNCQPIAAAIEQQLLGDGVRTAVPGEFTLRAFLAGRIDLLQAEGVLGLVRAQNLDELRFALDQRTGGQSRPILAARETLLDLLADLEAGLDFTEDDISFLTELELLRRVSELRGAVTRQLTTLTNNSFEQLRPRIVLVGQPNAGKSSLFNALTGNQTAALVSEMPGTTRDVVTGTTKLGDIECDLVDTAGWEPNSANEISRQATDQRLRWMGTADLVLECIPVGDAASEVDSSADHLRVRTKADLNSEFRDPVAAAHVSILQAESLEELRLTLAARVLTARSATGNTARCSDCLQRSITSLDLVLTEANLGRGPEVLSVYLRDALDALGETVGAVYTEDLLGRVFSRFCIGK